MTAPGLGLCENGGRHDYDGIASSIPQTADDLLHRPSRPSRANAQKLPFQSAAGELVR
jgi:hypothetical protein